MKILIVGAGRAGLEVATQLSRVGHAVTIVDTDPAVARRAAEQFGLVALAGDATTAEVLDDAAIGRMDIVVAMLRRDADNLAVSLLARAAGEIETDERNSAVATAQAAALRQTPQVPGELGVGLARGQHAHGRGHHDRCSAGGEPLREEIAASDRPLVRAMFQRLVQTEGTFAL